MAKIKTKHTNIIVKDNDQFLECPICGKHYKSLVMHIMEIHKMTIKDFKLKYPDLRMQLVPPKLKVNCPFCKKTINGNSALACHISKMHGKVKYLEWKKQNNISGYNNKIDKSNYPKCKICGKVTQQICQHVRLSHNIDWDEYCTKYNYDGPKTYFSKAHHQHLS